jgi:hypothetical protein
MYYEKAASSSASKSEFEAEAAGSAALEFTPPDFTS